MNQEQQPHNPDDQAEAMIPLPEQEPRLSPQIWVGSLADYNNGDLHGEWLDAARDPDEIHADIQTMLGRGPAARRGEAPEEWGIFDYEDFGSLTIGEYESIGEVSHLAVAIAEHGPAFAAWAEATDREQATSDGFLEAYRGRYDSVADYARQLIEDLGCEQSLDEAAPGWLRPYLRVDYEAFARDLLLGGDIFTAPAANGVYIYDGNA